MPIDPKEALEFIGYKPDDFESLDKFKEAYNADFVRVKEAANRDDIAGAIFGKANGVIRNKLNTLAKGLGVEVDKADIEGKNPTEIIELLQERIAEKLAAIPELEKKLEGAAPADALKAWEEKYGKLEKRASEFEASAKAVQDELERMKEAQAKEKADRLANETYGKALGTVKYREDVHPMARKGFEAEFRAKYRPDTLDDGTLVAVDAEGNRVPNPKKAGAYLSMEELAALEAERAELVSKNPHAGKPAGAGTAGQGGQGATRITTGGGDGGRERKAVPMAAAAEEAAAEE